MIYWLNELPGKLLMDKKSGGGFFPAGAVLWLDAADASTISFSSGKIVSEWRDKSGNANNFSVVNYSNGPDYDNNGVIFQNNQSGFDANPLTVEYLSRGSFAPANPYIFIVIDSIGAKTGHDHAIISQYQDSIRYKFAGISNAAGTFYARTRNSTNYTASTSAVSPGATRVLATFVWTGTNFRSVSVNNGAASTNTNSTSISPDSMLIGIDRAASGGYPASGLIATIREIIMFSGAPDPSMVSATVNYLKTKWSIDGVSIYWPNELPAPLIGTTYNPVDPQIRTTMQSGRALARRKFTVVPVRFQARWIFRSDAHAALFEDFYRVVTIDGTDWFAMPLLLPQGRDYRSVRFIGPYSGPKRVNPPGADGDFWEYSAVLEMSQRPSEIDPISPPSPP